METKEKKELRTRYDEMRLRTLSPSVMLDCYLVEPAKRTWKENFVDEDSGETATVERNEIVEQAGTLITQDVLARLKFFIDAGELKEVLVSNQKRQGARVNYNALVPYTVTLKPFCGSTIKLLVRANSLQMALQIAEDYGDYIIAGNYRVNSAKKEDNFYIIDYPAKDKEENADPDVYYKIDAVISITKADGTELVKGSAKAFLLPSPDADEARKLILREIAQAYKKEHGVVSVELTLFDARTFSASDIVPVHFSQKYYDMYKAEAYIMDGQRFGAHPA